MKPGMTRWKIRPVSYTHLPGVGPARRKGLMKKFQSLDALREASVEELAGAPSMNLDSARKVYHFFHGDD